MTKRKKIKAIGILFAIVIAAGLMLLCRFKYAAEYRIADIDSSVSADGCYELLFQSVGEPDWPFGYSHARFVLKHNGSTIAKNKFDVANDGKILCEGNWKVSWKNSTVEVLVSGEEQQDALYVLAFDGKAAQKY